MMPCGQVSLCIFQRDGNELMYNHEPHEKHSDGGVSVSLPF